MASTDYILTQRQKKWLIKLVNHKNWEVWLSVTKNERGRIRAIIDYGSYSEDNRKFLNEIVEYYKANRGIYSLND